MSGQPDAQGQAGGRGQAVTLVYRARPRDVIMATLFSLPAVLLGIGAVVLVVLDGLADAWGLAVFALAWTVVSVLLWLNARQQVTLAPDALLIQRRLVRRVVPYHEVQELSSDLARGVTLRTVGGQWLMLPWPPLRTASGAGMARAQEVHDELARRVEAARANGEGLQPG